MLRAIITYFVERHLLTNLAFVAVFVLGFVAWGGLKKEELPDVTFDFVRISANYPGASAEEVEYFVTREIELALEGLDGIHQIRSSVGQGSTTVTVELEQNYSKKDEAIMEIRNAVAGVPLPEEITREPSVRVFETSKKAILDIALLHTGAHLMNDEERQLLQSYARSLEKQLLSLREVHRVNHSGYLDQEVHIKADPQKLLQYKLPLSHVRSEIIRNHAYQPVGTLEVKNEPKVTVNAKLDTLEKLKDVYIQAGFEGGAIQLSDIAQIQLAYDRGKEINKVNGHEAVMFSVVKSSSAGILEALEAVTRQVEIFKETHLKDSPIDIALLDDESIDVRNRLSIISSNGLLGFSLILLMLFLFLSKRSSIWVALGIPFAVCFTMICGWITGYTINNITLAALIIVMGIVVDDAIIVAENIGRMKAQGMDEKEAAIEGTRQVFLPIVASIITTCVAFIPLYYFGGRFGQFNKVIPTVVFFMLGASLFESLIILPGHMRLKFRLPFSKKSMSPQPKKRTLFDKIEAIYGTSLERVLRFKYLVVLLFVGLLGFSMWVVTSKMKFVLFPNEETRDIVLSGVLDRQANRFDTANVTKVIEDMLKPYLGKEVVGYRTGIARSRRGGAVNENQFRMIIEIVPKDQRERSADELTALWKAEIDQMTEIKRLFIRKSRWGQTSGSALEVLIQENDDTLRAQAAETIASYLKEDPRLTDVDIEESPKVAEYKVDFKRETIKRLGINPSDITSTLRSSLIGHILYTFIDGDEEVNVRLTIQDDDKTQMASVLKLPVENRGQYLVSLSSLVNVKTTQAPTSISRLEGRRTTTVYADIDTKSTQATPLQIAESIETNLFPQIAQHQPSTILSFTGEVLDTREAGNDFRQAILMVLFLIFAILAILYNSVVKPIIIMCVIPFGVIGVILAFWLHGKVLFGFFAAIGTLGLIGVVINDSIIMLSKMDKHLSLNKATPLNQQIAQTAQTRLKAVFLTTVTTVAGILPTAYGIVGYDAMLAEMMLALAWGLIFGSLITLVLMPCLYSIWMGLYVRLRKHTPSHV